MTINVKLKNISKFCFSGDLPLFAYLPDLTYPPGSEVLQSIIYIQDTELYELCICDTVFF